MSSISYSGWKRYMTCAKMYEYHYNQGLRPALSTSALVFGSAVDTALNALLLKTGDPLVVFRDVFKFEDMVAIEWDSRDYDPELFDADQLAKVANESFAYKAWASMRIKGRMLIEAYISQIYPLIEEVHHVQKQLDDRNGILDAIVTLKGYGKVLIDHKTSARPYMPDAVSADTQLALYAHSEGLDKGGFIVLVKEIQKNRVKICKKCGFNGSFTRHKTCPQVNNGIRCFGHWEETTKPEAMIQVIIDDIPVMNKILITSSIHETEKAIDAGNFPMNLGACGKIYGNPCPYIKKCWKNDETGLVLKKEEKK